MSADRSPHNAPSADDPYRDCEVYLEHGACVCSTGYPASCQVVLDRDEAKIVALLAEAQRGGAF